MACYGFRKDGSKLETQWEVTLEFMKENGSCNSFEMFSEFGFTRLSGIIFVLRKKGYNILTVHHVKKNRYGGTVVYGSYHLQK